MYIHRGILLIIILMFIFSPVAQEWMSNNNAQWYRPYIGWSVIIFITYMSQKRHTDNATRDNDV